MNGLEEHNAIYEAEVAKSKERFATMTTKQLELRQEIARLRYQIEGPTHEICARLDVLRELLQ